MQSIADAIVFEVAFHSPLWRDFHFLLGTDEVGRSLFLGFMQGDCLEDMKLRKLPEWPRVGKWLSDTYLYRKDYH